MSQRRQWYRLGFRDTTPEFEVTLEIGCNTTGRTPIFFLAPTDEEGHTLMSHMRSVGADAEGRPNGYYATPEDAQEAVASQLQAQIDRMQEALQKVREATPGPELVLAGVDEDGGE